MSTTGALSWDSSLEANKHNASIIPLENYAPQTPIQHWLVVLHYIYPLILLLFFLGSLTWWGISTSGKKPQPVWVSPTVTEPSSPNRVRSPSPLSDIGESTEPEDEEEPLLGMVTADGIVARGWMGRVGQKFAAWFRGDLEDYAVTQQQQSSFPEKKKNVVLTPVRKAIMSWGLLLVIISLIANCTNIILHALVKIGWWCGQDVVVRLP